MIHEGADLDGTPDPTLFPVELMPHSKASKYLACLGAALLLASCKESGPPQCINPADPTCVTVTNVTVAVLSAPVDTVIQVGRTSVLTASATAGGSPVTTLPVAWSSTVTATATVDPNSGVVTAVAPGSTMIRATVDGIAGQQRMIVANADLPLISAVVGDTLADALRQALSNTPRAAVTTGLATCATHVGTGNLVALNGCFANVMGVSAGSNASDSTLLGVLDLFFNFARRQLPL